MADPTFRFKGVVVPVWKSCLDSLPVVFREYVLAIAQGLQSSDPRNGVYVLLQPFGINRDATNVNIVREQFDPNRLNLSLPFNSP